MRYIFCAFVICSIINYSCNSGPKSFSKTDTVICAYQENHQWRFNLAQVYAHTGRMWVGDSGLESKMGVIREIRLGLPVAKTDSVFDSVKHSLLVIIPHFGAPLQDSLNHYIHILDTLHFPPTVHLHDPKH
jgi:hypothetical protein